MKKLLFSLLVLLALATEATACGPLARVAGRVADRVEARQHARQVARHPVPTVVVVRSTSSVAPPAVKVVPVPTPMKATPK